MEQEDCTGTGPPSIKAGMGNCCQKEYIDCLNGKKKSTGDEVRERGAPRESVDSSLFLVS